MKQLLAVGVISIVALSMCTGLPDLGFGNVSQAGFTTIESGSPNLFITAAVVPSEVRSGRDASLRFDIQNNNQYSISDISIIAYDTCIFTGNTSKTISEIKPNRSAEVSMKLTSGSISMDRECNIKFRLSYNAEHAIYNDVAVLSASEYEQRELAGTLETIQVGSQSQSGPLSIDARFSEEQPFIDGDRYYLYMDYYANGDGILTVKSGDIRMTVPSNMKNFACDDYNSNMTLSNSLNFVSGRAPNSVCSFTASTATPMSIQTLYITADYTYEVYGSVPVSVERA